MVVIIALLLRGIKEKKRLIIIIFAFIVNVIHSSAIIISIINFVAQLAWLMSRCRLIPGSRNDPIIALTTAVSTGQPQSTKLIGFCLTIIF